MLQLKNGQFFCGNRFGSNKLIGGECCFTTAMVGFPQSLTDPSYAGQILIFSYPMIGNHKIGSYNEVDEYNIPIHFESNKIHVKGVIVSEYCHFTTDDEKNLDEWLKQEDIPGLYNVDTRSLIELLRDEGCMYGEICDKLNDIKLIEENSKLYETINWVKEVSIKSEIYYETKKLKCGTLLIIDCGIKNGILRELLNLGFDLQIERYDRLFDERYDFTYDGIIISNGPGSPNLLLNTTIKEIKKLLIMNQENYHLNCKILPIMGICLGHQIIALASGGNIYKMKFGNRGLNHPCIDQRTMRCYITSQNHGYAVNMKSLSNQWKSLFINLNDNSNEGIIHEYLPIFSIQFHPEGCPGPYDTNFLFHEFKLLVKNLHHNLIKLCKWNNINKNINKVLLLGSGPLMIAQSGEFDYSGSQAIKALIEEGIEVILMNPNIASVQSSLTPHTYFYPITSDFVKKVIEIENPQGILLQFGGQTALNCGIELKDYLKDNNIQVLGTSINNIIKTEDREIFSKCIKDLNELTIESKCITNIDDGLKYANIIGYPILIRSGFCLGGFGSGFANNDNELILFINQALKTNKNVIIDKSLKGYKEIEYEVMRDINGNCIAVCNMENFDPVSIHTGDSIVVSPSQTITNYEYFAMRNSALKIISYFEIIGECNIQFALHPNNSTYYVIEVNARLSRSSALASKATGYPLAYIAAKLSLGKLLINLNNEMTKLTSACYEPSMDYIIVKMPHWDFSKFSQTSRELNTTMKSIGEVMSIGRNFEEAFQKAMRMKNMKFDEMILWNEINTDKRILSILTSLRYEYKSIYQINDETKIDLWFLSKLKNLIDLENQMKQENLNLNNYILFKKNGFSNDYIIKLTKNLLNNFNHIIPKSYPIDTSSGEFIAKSNYLYLSFWGNLNYENVCLKKSVSLKESVLILGCGTYRIGTSCEFDWCAVHTLKTLKSNNYKTIMINHNPETVSTDYNECDILYFEELSIETINIIYKKENISKGIIVSMGGQIPNCLVNDLNKNNMIILGTNPYFINIAENRELFSKTMDELNILQPEWNVLNNKENAIKFSNQIGFPVLVRPSYVISGSSMNVAFNSIQLEKYIDIASLVNNDYPVVISKFIENAKEIEYDGIAIHGKIINYAISEHVENAGCHSGDASLMLPAQKMYLSTMRQIRNISAKIALKLQITGCFNIQYLCQNNYIMVIECNLRASRSFPFVSKCFGVNFIELGTLAMLGKQVKQQKIEILNYEHVCVKVPMFSFQRLTNVDPVCGVEMISVGECGCFANHHYEAFLLSLLSCNFKIPIKSIFISIGLLKNKIEFIESAKNLQSLGYLLYGTEGTSNFLKNENIEIIKITKIQSIQFIQEKKFDLIINIPQNNKQLDITNGYLIRRSCIDNNISLLTNLQDALLLVEAMKYMNIIANTTNIANLFKLKKSSEFLSNKFLH